MTSILRNSKQSFLSRNRDEYWKQTTVLESNEALQEGFSHNTISASISDGTCAHNELDNANMLNNYYSKCFTTSLPPLYDSFESAEHLELPEGGLENLLCTEEEVICLLQSIDVLKQVP